MAKKKEQVAKKTAKLDDKALDKVQGGIATFAQAKDNMKAKAKTTVCCVGVVIP